MKKVTLKDSVLLYAFRFMTQGFEFQLPARMEGF